MSFLSSKKPWPEVAVGNKDHGNAAVIIIGAGLSGICTAIDLIKRNNCRNFIIVEKSAGLGGTWCATMTMSRDGSGLTDN